MYAVDHVKLVYHIKDKIESLTKNCYFNSSVLSPCFGPDQCTPDSLRELTEPYVLYIDSHFSLTTVRNITNEILVGI